MTAVDFDDLIRHDGHDIKLTYFGLEGKRENAVNVAIVCDTCEEVLFDYDKEEEFEKRTITLGESKSSIQKEHFKILYDDRRNRNDL